jgi:hypothetical protein
MSDTTSTLSWNNTANVRVRRSTSLLRNEYKNDNINVAIVSTVERKLVPVVVVDDDDEEDDALPGVDVVVTAEMFGKSSTNCTNK